MLSLCVNLAGLGFKLRGVDALATVMQDIAVLNLTMARDDARRLGVEDEDAAASEPPSILMPNGVAAVPAYKRSTSMSRRRSLEAFKPSFFTDTQADGNRPSVLGVELSHVKVGQ